MIALLLNRWVLGLIGSLALMAGLYFAWNHFVVEPYREEGRIQGQAKARAELLPLLEAATAQLDRDVAAFGEITKAFAVIKRESARLKLQAENAIVIKAARNKAADVRVEYIGRLVPSGANECERTSDSITKVLR